MRIPIGGYREEDYDFDPFVSVAAPQTAELANLLVNPTSYDFERAKGCAPDFGVRIRFTAAEGFVDVDLCFQCNILLVRKDGQPVWGEDFDPIRPQLAAICKQTFPADPEIQGLKLDR